MGTSRATPTYKEQVAAMERIYASQNSKVYVAGPFFNEPQVAMISRIQDILTKLEYPYYSPRLDSGSADLTPEQRKDPKAWDPVFDSNLRQLHSCKLMVACLSYPLAPQEGLYNLRVGEGGSVTGIGPRVEIPDSGTVFELGYRKMLSRTQTGLVTVGFILGERPEKLNLMLMKGHQGLLCGYAKLEQFLTVLEPSQPGAYTGHYDWSAVYQEGHEVE